MKYTMTFALSPDCRAVLLLRKPHNHVNPLFRDRWTAPGGHIEDGEDELSSALREMAEETRLTILPAEMRFVLRFACNCDPLEAEHEVAVYAALLPVEILQVAVGVFPEIVRIYPTNLLPCNLLWYAKPLLELVIGRVRQPRPLPENGAACEGPASAGGNAK